MATPTKPKTCGNCRYWDKLIKTRKTFGLCSWFNTNPMPKVPVWAHWEIYSGAISPDQEGCGVWERKK